MCGDDFSYIGFLPGESKPNTLWRERQRSQIIWTEFQR